MRTTDLLRFTGQSINRHRFRSAMLLVAMAVGVASVVLLTGLGQGARIYVLNQLTFLGSDTFVVLPGKTETTGGMPPLTGTAARDITLEDAMAVNRLAKGIDRLAPLVLGTAPTSFGSRSRETIVMGTTADFFAIRQLEIGLGTGLPALAIDQSKPVCVLGQKTRTELFGAQPVIGRWLRINDSRCRVIGIIKGRGDAFGMDLSDAVFIPIASAQALFNTEAVFRLMIKVKSNATLKSVEKRVRMIMQARHQGEEDITLVRPDAMRGTFDALLKTLTTAVTGIAAISLFVAGILIMNVTWITVNQRTREIGLLKAIGAPASQIRTLFLTEATSLAMVGALLGIAGGEALLWAGRSLFPDIPFQAPLWAIFGGLAVALGAGILFAYLPANQAAKLEPVSALS